MTVTVTVTEMGLTSEFEPGTVERIMWTWAENLVGAGPAGFRLLWASDALPGGGRVVERLGRG